MTDDHHIPEPPVDPLADTSPSLAVRPPEMQQLQQPARWRRVVALLSLLGAAAFTLATIFVLLTPVETAPAPVSVPPTETIIPTAANTVEATATDVPVIADAGAQQPVYEPLPVLSAEMAAALLQTPIAPLEEESTFLVDSDPYNPFTIIPDRPRNEVIQYTAVRGDNIDSIAERFSLAPETVAWSNTRRYIEVLYPGDEVNILPVNGAYHTVIGSDTLAEIAASYGLDDAYSIIDSEYNNLFGVEPETTLPSGTRLVIPGGQAEEISWNPGGLEVDEGTGYVASFATGQSGSCGRVNPSGGAYWANPLPNGTWVRGFSAYHPAIDLAAPVGTPVYAANSGPVLYSGWNSWGFGNTVVLAHGPYTTLYGHLQSVNVRCGQVITVGQVIGYVGSTGNSSGPHLHFEIRYLDTPADPSATSGIGW